MDIKQCRLTKDEISGAIDATPYAGISDTNTAWGDEYDRAVADAATAKALCCVLLWLQEFEDNHRAMPEDVTGIDRGHGLEMAAAELEALLAGKQLSPLMEGE